MIPALGATTLPAGAQTHFMQVAILSKGECFGVGGYA